MNHSGLQQTRAQLPNPQVARTCLGQRCPNSFWERGRGYPTGAAMAPGGSGWQKCVDCVAAGLMFLLLGVFSPQGADTLLQMALDGTTHEVSRKTSPGWWFWTRCSRIVEANLSQEDWTYLKLAPAPMQAASTDSLMSLSLWGYNVWPSDTSTTIVATLGGFGFFSGFSQVLSAYNDGPSILLTSATWSIKDHATPTSRCCELSPEPLGLTWKVAHERWVKWSLPRNHVDTLNEYIILYNVYNVFVVLSSLRVKGLAVAVASKPPHTIITAGNGCTCFGNWGGSTSLK
jgi:hypothetical protein